ncbi:hypothetical protein D3C71_1993990 [compost metagenome]
MRAAFGRQRLRQAKPDHEAEQHTRPEQHEEDALPGRKPEQLASDNRSRDRPQTVDDHQESEEPGKLRARIQVADSGP